jgi:hypothetical protein
MVNKSTQEYTLYDTIITKVVGKEITLDKMPSISSEFILKAVREL